MTRVALFVMLLVGCTYSVDDGHWTYTWRTGTTTLSDSSAQWNQSCRASAEEPAVLAHLRASRLRTCTAFCAARPEEIEGCTLACDASLVLVSAQCAPSSHEEELTLPVH